MTPDPYYAEVGYYAVRQAVREGDHEKIDKLLPLEVANYIRKYGLYRNTNEA